MGRGERRDAARGVPGTPLDQPPYLGERAPPMGPPPDMHSWAAELAGASSSWPPGLLGPLCLRFLSLFSRTAPPFFCFDGLGGSVCSGVPPPTRLELSTGGLPAFVGGTPALRGFPRPGPCLPGFCPGAVEMQAAEPGLSRAVQRGRPGQTVLILAGSQAGPCADVFIARQ